MTTNTIVHLNANRIVSLQAACYMLLARCYYALNFENIADAARDSIQEVQEVLANVTNNKLTRGDLNVLALLCENITDGDDAIINDLFAIYEEANNNEA